MTGAAVAEGSQGSGTGGQALAGWSRPVAQQRVWAAWSAEVGTTGTCAQCTFFVHRTMGCIVHRVCPHAQNGWGVLPVPVYLPPAGKLKLPVMSPAHGAFGWAAYRCIMTLTW